MQSYRGNIYPSPVIPEKPRALHSCIVALHVVFLASPLILLDPSMSSFTEIQRNLVLVEAMLRCIMVMHGNIS